MHKNIQIASLDLFWMPRLQRALSSDFETEILSTWSLKKSFKNADLRNKNAYFLHYLLQAYKMVPAIRFNNHTYYHLCRAFDLWLSGNISDNSDALICMSGFGLASLKKAKHKKFITIIECGSAHTDYQHNVLIDEYKKNGIINGLFPANYRNRVKKEFEEADYIQIPGTFVRNTFLEAGVPPEKLLLAHYGADLDIFSPKSPPTGDTPFRIICPSGVNIRKGARILVEAWKKLSWDDAELHWIGSITPETEHLFKSETKGICFHKWMSHLELSNLYRSCDVMCLPTFEDGFAMVVVEAAACGVPSILTPNSCAQDFFTQGNPEGWLIPVNSVDALCESLIEAKADRQKTYERGLKALARAKSGFSWDDYGTRVRANLHQILG